MDDTTEVLDSATTEEAPAGEVSLRDALEANYDKATASTAPAEETPFSQEPAAVSEPAQGEVTPAVNTPPTTPPEDIPPRLQSKWADKWAALDPAVKAEFKEYESNIGRLVAKYGKAAQDWDRVEQTLTPYQDLIREQGGNPHQVIGSMLETARLLHRGTQDQKQALLFHIIQRFGIPVHQTAEGAIQLIPPSAPPEILNRMSELEHKDLTMRASADYTVRQEVATELDTFLANPANAYVKEPGYLDTMADLIRTGRAKDLADAYGQAAWLNEKTRKLEIAKANQQAIAPRVTQAAAARQAAVSVPGNAPGNTRRDPAKMTLRDTLAAAWDGELS